MLGFLQCWQWRFSIAHGAVSYLDMGDAYFRGDRTMEINGYFNPLYSWILGAVVHTLRPDMRWEYPVVHLIVFATYVLALFCFAFLWKELLLYREMTPQGRLGAGFLRPPAWVWLVLGYSIFTWVSLDLIRVRETNPDMLIAAFFYLACGLLIRMRRGSKRWLVFVLYGAALGLGYLTKAAFFPIAFVFLAVALFAATERRSAIPRIALSALVFALIAGPWVAALSRSKGRLTFGDAGRLNYAWCVNDVPMRHWQGSPEDGVPLHPTRQITSRPAAYEFAGPVGGTYPAVYDPSYWYEGLKPRFVLAQQISALRDNLYELGSMFLRLNGSVFASIVLLAFLSGRKRELLGDLRAYWFLLVPCLACLLMYALVLVYGRYVGSMMAVLALIPFVAIPLPQSREAGRTMAGVAIVALVMIFAPIGPSAIPKYLHGVGAAEIGRDLPWQVASEITRLGLQPGDRIATTNYAKDPDMEWAHLARVQIVGEVFYRYSMPQTHSNEFWRADPAAQEKILAAFARAGAKVVVSDREPHGRVSGDWRRLGSTNVYFLRLAPTRQTKTGPSPSGEPQSGAP